MEPIKSAAIFFVEHLGREVDDSESIWLGHALSEERTELIKRHVAAHERFVDSSQILTVQVNVGDEIGVITDR